MLDDSASASDARDVAGDDLEIIACCPMCGSSRSETAAEGVRDLNYGVDDGAFTFLRCMQCRSLWLRERPVGARLRKAYDGYYTHAEPDDEADSSSLKGAVRSLYVRSKFGSAPGLVSGVLSGLRALAGRNHLGIDRQYRFAPKPPAKVLDYGCGNGAYLMRLWRLGHAVHGLEYDPQLVGRLAELGIVVDDVTQVEDGHWHEEFDHITLAHVLEHVPDPHALLARLFKWLKPGGTLFIEVPNGDAAGFALFGRNWRCLETPRHFVMPSRGALFDALAKAGFVGTRQFIDSKVRDAMWQSSLKACPADDAAKVRSAMERLPVQTPDGAEYLTVLAAKPKVS
jgi:2-polyprenyl-3-methyl-5-hydroxy-6-metoxy-1,4-benzoquinol methylase